MDKVSNLILRLGVAFAFLYPPIDALFDPTSWFGYFPGYLQHLAPEPVLLHGFGLIEIIIALWILSGKKIFWPSLAAAGILLVIVGSDLADFQIVFRDLSIAAAAVALALNARQKGLSDTMAV